MFTKKQILSLIIIVIFISSLVVVSVIKQPKDNQSVKEPYIPFYQRLVIVAEYSPSLCPNIAVIVERNNTNITANFELIKNINQTLYYAKLGTYDTNDATTPLLFRWANATNDCVSRYQVMTNNDFLAFLMENGVEVEVNKTQEPELPNSTPKSKPL